MYLVALFAGKWQPTAYRRALGCERAVDFHALSPDQVSERHRNAMRRIFKRRGVKLAKRLAKSGMRVPRRRGWLRRDRLTTLCGIRQVCSSCPVLFPNVR
jgi:hypothetical protein